MAGGKDGLVDRRIVTPPALPRIVAPRAATRRAEFASTHDLGADVRSLLVQHGGADVFLATPHPRHSRPPFQRDDPRVEPFATFAEGLVLGLVRTGDVPVH